MKRMKRKARRPLPPPCSLCSPYGGLWRLAGPDAFESGLERCDCPRGRALAAGPVWHRPGRLAHDGRMAGAGQ